MKPSDYATEAEYLEAMRRHHQEQRVKTSERMKRKYARLAERDRNRPR